jgi:hypothetical protein
MSSESELSDADMGMQRKKLMKIMMRHHGKSRKKSGEE